MFICSEATENFKHFGQPVLLVKGARINAFGGGKSLSIVGSILLNVSLCHSLWHSCHKCNLFSDIILHYLITDGRC